MFSLRGSVRRIVHVAMLLSAAAAAYGSDLDATLISTSIRRLHMPYGTILDPVFASSDPASADYMRIAGYTRAGDSAIWTGHYLAAEAFRYQTTRSPEAFENAWAALHGIRSLLDVTGNDVLARCLIPSDSLYAAAIKQEEGRHGIYDGTLGGRSYFWIGETSRDQYSGVMFGLSAAYDLLEDATARDFIRNDVTRILNYLLSRGWTITMPDGRISTTFLLRPDQELSFLQIGRHINPERFSSTYFAYRSAVASSIAIPIAYDNVDDHNHYFKFNLNYINLYDLIRLEEDSSPYRQTYMEAYDLLRQRTGRHRNAHFNMLDRALKGADSARDAETGALLDLWLKRPDRDQWVDLRGRRFASCGSDRTCRPTPVNRRVNTDFLWQRSPFLSYGGGTGVVETAGIDYILPYWMKRAFGF